MKKLLETLETSLVEIAIRLVSILAPVPTAALIVTRTVKYLEWPLPVAWIAGIVIEGFGFTSIQLVLALHQYNISKRQKDPKAPVFLAACFVAIYVVCAIGLTVALDTLPGLATYAPIVFPFISLCGAGMLAVRYNHTQRLIEIANQKAQDREERKRQKEAKQLVPMALPSVQRGTFEEFSNDNLQRNGNGPMTAKEVMAKYHVPKRTAYNWIERVKNG